MSRPSPLRVDDPTNNNGYGWRQMSADEIADHLYFTVRTIPKHLLRDFGARDPRKGDQAARRLAEMLAERLSKCAVFKAATRESGIYSASVKVKC